MSINVVLDETSASVRKIIALKSIERYEWRFRIDRAGELLRHLGTQAANPEISLTWHDAAVVSQHIRSTTEVS